MQKFVPFVLLSSIALFAASAEEQVSQAEARLDSLPDYATSTLIGKDDKPVSVSGDVAIRLKNFYYDEPSPLQKSDAARTSIDAVFNAAIAATPSSNVNFWTTLMFPFDFSGYFQNALASSPNNGPYNHSDRVPFSHSTDYYGTTLWESMTAGIDMRGGAFAAMFKAGGVLWANQSPLTMWERETMARFVSQYELFEDEKTVSTYYKEKTFRPVKEGGRAFWTNRSFGGLMLDVYSLPADFTAQFLLSQPMDMDPGTRDGLKMYGGQPGELEMVGNLDMRGTVVAGRLAKQKVFKDVTLGVNYLGVDFSRDILYEPEFYRDFKPIDRDPYLVNNRIISLDIKGDMIPNLFAFIDIAMSFDDSTLFRKQWLDTAKFIYEQDFFKSTSSTPQPGFYAKIQDKHWEPITLEAVYLPKNFFSPYGMSDNSRFRSWRKDEFYLGAGTFRYTPNLVGANIKFEPVLNRGRFDVQYGQHTQVEEGNDVLLFNYRLNGRAMWEGTNSWTKHKPLFNSDSGNGDGAARYVSRVGVLDTAIKFNRQKGGRYGGTWETWESFVPYQNASQMKQLNEDSLHSMPRHKKWSSVLSFDMGYDIGHWFNTDRNIMMAAYVTLSGVSTSIAPLAYSEKQKDMLLWSAFVQSEPAIAITPTLHAVGILGFETWRAPDAWVVHTVVSTFKETDPGFDIVGKQGVYYELAPINYLQTALGFGFDWDFAPRAGLHVRYKRATHTDEAVSENNWKTHIVSAETKVWF